MQKFEAFFHCGDIVFNSIFGDHYFGRETLLIRDFVFTEQFGNGI